MREIGESETGVSEAGVSKAGAPVTGAETGAVTDRAMRRFETAQRGTQNAEGRTQFSQRTRTEGRRRGENRGERGEGETPLPETLDAITVEEPLEIQVAGDPLAVTMRTPGDDRFLAVGFLFAEGVIASMADIGTVAHCGRPGDEGFGNTIDVSPGPGASLDLEALEGTRRGTLTTASCGVCGRRSIADLLERIGGLQDTTRVAREMLLSSPAALSSQQRSFTRTGGSHAAAVLRADGTCIAHAEDVGRHNAVDKVVGKLLYGGQLADAVVLAVSGRVSFEIVQKAAAARIPVITAVSAPTSLAIDLAQKAEITLAAFVREGRMNVYTGAERID